ncbi:unnamed protein product [Nippostrongylus brasiliensis]|uniref:DDA1 domain-containing protein n=1 Tax=Nippostrongylus brasiliensis TaxID=27835 RepID=A0A0N4Y951_NIPBR|nr:hypothetical protein Q1695_009462 [Nippostrongylus brasiliensis]VDL76399.1 unnamed protein product [Nippostrongylus brasiliensis]
MASFLADLPSTNPLHFSQLPEKDLKSCDGVKAVKTAFHVPRRDDEKQIVNDKKPYILRFLEKQWKVRRETSKERSDSPKTKKEKVEVMKKRARCDAPSTSSDPKTRRIS